MMFRLLKHNTVGGEYHFSGTTIRMSVFDKVLDDGRLVYHYGKDRYEVIPAEAFKIVYDSQTEMERELSRQKGVAK
jgi:hypothetical protein